MPWIVKAQPWKLWAPIIKHDGKLSARYRFARGALRDKSDPDTLDCGVQHQPIIVQRELAGYVNVHRLATALELPVVDPSISHSIADARVL
jgi:hypothetical protein